VKSKLNDGGNLSKEAKKAFTRATGLFILYITSCASELAKEKRRNTVFDGCFLKINCLIFLDKWRGY